MRKNGKNQILRDILIPSHQSVKVRDNGGKTIGLSLIEEMEMSFKLRPVTDDLIITKENPRKTDSSLSSKPKQEPQEMTLLPSPG